MSYQAQAKAVKELEGRTGFTNSKDELEPDNDYYYV